MSPSRQRNEVEGSRASSKGVTSVEPRQPDVLCAQTGAGWWEGYVASAASKTPRLLLSSNGLPDASRMRLDNLEEWLGRQQEAVRKLIEVSQQDRKDVGIAVAEATAALKRFGVIAKKSYR